MNRAEKVKWINDFKNGKIDIIKKDCVVFDPDVDAIYGSLFLDPDVDETLSKCAHLDNGVCKPNCEYYRNKSTAKLLKFDESTGRYGEYFDASDFE